MLSKRSRKKGNVLRLGRQIETRGVFIGFFSFEQLLSSTNRAVEGTSLKLGAHQASRGVGSILHFSESWKTGGFYREMPGWFQEYYRAWRSTVPDLTRFFDSDPRTDFLPFINALA